MTKSNQTGLEKEIAVADVNDKSRAVRLPAWMDWGFPHVMRSHSISVSAFVWLPVLLEGLIGERATLPILSLWQKSWEYLQFTLLWSLSLSKLWSRVEHNDWPGLGHVPSDWLGSGGYGDVLLWNQMEGGKAVSRPKLGSPTTGTHPC